VVEVKAATAAIAMATAAAAAAAAAIKFVLFLLSLRPSTVPYFLGILTYRGCRSFSS